MKVPRWLKLQEEIDYLYFCLNEARKQMPKSGLDAEIDRVTGFEASRNQEIKEILIRMKELKAEWSKETGEEAPTEMEDKMLELLGET
jgi:SPX domain protein involved in polyphosphate accumulation